MVRTAQPVSFSYKPPCVVSKLVSQAYRTVEFEGAGIANVLGVRVGPAIGAETVLEEVTV